MSDILTVNHVQHRPVGAQKALVDVVYSCSHGGRLPYNPTRITDTDPIVADAAEVLCPQCSRNAGMALKAAERKRNNR